jgi:Tc toxin complex TcA C-terminal TcB-binding domain
MSKVTAGNSFHDSAASAKVGGYVSSYRNETKLDYTFYNHFHPFVGELIEQLNRRLVGGLLDVDFHASLVASYFKAEYDPQESTGPYDTVDAEYFPKNIDVSERGPYSIYNWELLFHVPFAVAVHLSKNQRFPEAQRWFHYIFDPTCDDTSVPVPQRFWKFLRFRQSTPMHSIDELLRILSKKAADCTAEELDLKELILSGYEEIRDNPFKPHVVARSRHVAYQYAVVMKYLDNLIAWGDSLFRQDTIESINEATQIYVLAANILGERPQNVPERGTMRARSFKELQQAGLDPFGNALVELEGQFPFDLASPTTPAPSDGAGEALFGMGRSLYFSVPPNDKLLAYWDTVDDRLSKIRNCMNIEGVVRQLALFDPPIDPGMLVKAAAAGIDISTMLTGLKAPASPVRAASLIQKALELAGEVRSMGASLLQALEKRDGEAFTLLRHQHEMAIQELVQDVRYLQWKEAEASTDALLRSRATTFDRYRHHMLLLGRPEQEIEAFAEVQVQRTKITEENFDERYEELVGAFAGDVTVVPDGPYTLAEDSSPQIQSGASGVSQLNLLPSEAQDLNTLMGDIREHMDDALSKDELYGVLGLLPNLGVNFKFWGIGGHLEFGGPMLAAVGRILAGKDRGQADKADHTGKRAVKVGGYQRRAIDGALQANSAAHELMANGRQLIASMLREQSTRQEYESHKRQRENARAEEEFLQEKFTQTELYAWMQGELSKLYYDCYRFAFDTARRAELTLKRELMRPELDDVDFVKFNYWDGGRKGLLAGERLYGDVKRLELARLDNDKREYELTRHVSLQQLDPTALLRLRATGSCEIATPEWLFDLDTPGHYMRRLKSVAVTLPAVTGPYTSVHCTLSLLRSSIRTKPALRDGQYARHVEDDRFLDYTGSVQSIVTSTGDNDSGMFESNLHDERYLPFEGQGAVASWRIELPTPFRSWDYDSLSDVILHLRYTAREGGGLLRRQASTELATALADTDHAALTRVLALRSDFPSQWQAFAGGNDNFQASVPKTYFPYIAQGRDILVTDLELVAEVDGELIAIPLPGMTPDEATTALADQGAIALSIPEDDDVMVREPGRVVFLRVEYGIGA